MAKKETAGNGRLEEAMALLICCRVCRKPFVRRSAFRHPQANSGHVTKLRHAARKKRARLAVREPSGLFNRENRQVPDAGCCSPYPGD